MATTTNYGWTTPDNTALVKDGASAIRTLGSSIDTTLKAQIDAQIPDSLLTTKGDLIAATGASTPARLAVGTNGQALLANSATATGLEWATPASGGMTLISTTTLNAATVTISSIPSSYVNLMLIVRNARPVNDTASTLLRFNSDATSSRHTQNSAGVAVQTDQPFNSEQIAISRASDNGTVQSLSVTTIFDYANTTTWKGGQTLSITNNPTTTTNTNSTMSYGWYNQTGAISSLQLITDYGTGFTSGTALLYGVK
jgi:hypothetical protein